MRDGLDVPLRPDDDEPQQTLVASFSTDRPVRERPLLRWTDGAGAHESDVTRLATVGSSPAASIVVADRLVSRLHAELELRDDGLWVRDLGSTNGTYVGDVLVRHARVPEGASLRVGETTLILEQAEEPAPVDLWPTDHFGPLFGGSRIMRELFAYLARIAKSDASVLLHGETGTGKEVVARAIHEGSPRAAGPLVVVDCASIPENLIESELFGHAKGAFTGAHAARMGALEAASGGTLLLDEIGELPLAMQPKLLRVLETREVRPVGETKSRRVDVRFLSASHRDLRRMVNAGAFREDLYFRLAVLPVKVPPLRERPEDVALLVRRFAQGLGGEVGPAVVEALRGRPWYGNVRELRNFVERAVAVGDRRALDMTSINGSISPPAPPEGAGASSLAKMAAALPALAPALPAAPASAPSSPDASAVPSAAREARGPDAAVYDAPYREFRDRWLEQGEREYLARLLERNGRQMNVAAQAAGVDRTYLYRLLRKYGL